MTICPLCNQPVEARGVLVSVETRTLGRVGWDGIVNLRPNLTAFLHALAVAMPAAISIGVLTKKIWPDEPPFSYRTSLRMLCHDANRVVHIFNLAVVPIRGKGYVMIDSEDPQRAVVTATAATILAAVRGDKA